MAIRPLADGAYLCAGFPLVEFLRRPDPQPLRGFLIEYSESLTLIHQLETGTWRLNGYAVFRNEDVRKWRPVVPEEFTARACRAQRLRPKRPAGVETGTWPQALQTAGAAFPLITIHREGIKRDSCWVGRFAGLTSRSLTIHSIDPQAQWEGDERFALRDITLLEFGGEYERLLLKLAPRVTA